MSIADIEKVRAAEAAAEALRRKAEEEMAQIISSGKKEARDLIEKAGKDAEDAYKAAIEKADKLASEAYDKTIEAQKAVCEKIKTDGRAKIDGVIDDIVGKVTGI
ncbi:MAG: hypothetical protein MJ127_02095 [Mogibacterium sp.]|nr:hypothetical protein [Mogibacterium sp.]